MSEDFELARQGWKPQGDGHPGQQDETKPTTFEVQPLSPEGYHSWIAEPLSRRGFLQGAGLAAGGLAIASPARSEEVRKAERAVAPIRGASLAITINGEKKTLEVDPRISLLDLLREQLQMTGTKKGCDHGQCGACTVIADGRRINSCLSLALVHHGGNVTTVEGIAHGDDLHPMQTAFLDHDGYQCGYCTPGQLCSAVALLDEVKRGEPSFVTADVRKTGPVDLTADEIKERMSGNICRCGAYPGIVAAIQQASRQA
jgi:xanthine dehydrogenase YagT iron-sulfur-binding subunit